MVLFCLCAGILIYFAMNSHGGGYGDHDEVVVEEHHGGGYGGYGYGGDHGGGYYNEHGGGYGYGRHHEGGDKEDTRMAY